MIEEQAQVIAVQGDRIQIEVQPQSACGHCAQSSHCGTSVFGALFQARSGRYWLPNTVNAQIGDRLLIGIDETTLPKASFLAYILPLLALITGAISGAWLSTQEWVSIALALLFFFFSLWLIRPKQDQFQVKIIAVLNLNIPISCSDS